MMLEPTLEKLRTLKMFAMVNAWIAQRNDTLSNDEMVSMRCSPENAENTAPAGSGAPCGNYNETGYCTVSAVAGHCQVLVNGSNV